MKGKKPQGTLDDMSPEQAQMVAQIKADFSADFKEFPELCTTWHILRFLRAREFNYAKTKAMIEAAFAFRRHKNYKQISQIDMFSDRMLQLKQGYTSSHYGTDKDGRVIIIEKVSEYDSKIVEIFSKEDIEDYLIQRYERMLFIELPLSSLAHGKRVDNTFLLVDLKGVDVIRIFNSKMKAIVQIGTYVSQNSYPELLGMSFFVNTPLIFKAIWAIISMWLDKRTRAKFVFESDSALKKLQNYLDVDQLPVDMGGKNQTPRASGFGLWTDELEESYRLKSFFLKDRSPEYEFFYTPEEDPRNNNSLKKLSKQDLLGRPEFEILDETQVEIQKSRVSQFKVSLTPRNRN